MADGGLSIPLIDISKFRSADSAARSTVFAQVGAAAEQYGFMRLVGHGVAPDTVAGLFDSGKIFFAEPETTKMAIRDQASNRGYIPMFDNVMLGEKPAGQESFSMGHTAPPADPSLRDLPFYAPTPWPATVGFRAAMEGCYGELLALGQTVLEAMALHLGRPADFFATAMRDHYSNMRVIHYPAPAEIADVTDFGSRPHEDRGLITLLIQDGNGGLDVKGPDGAWIGVEPDPASVIVNVGRLLRLWTNGRYTSAIHRVVNRSGRSRQSIPLFMHPNFHQRVDPADFAAPGEKVRFEPVIAGEHTYSDFARQRPSWKVQTAAE